MSNNSIDIFNGLTPEQKVEVLSRYIPRISRSVRVPMDLDISQVTPKRLMSTWAAGAGYSRDGYSWVSRSRKWDTDGAAWLILRNGEYELTSKMPLESDDRLPVFDSWFKTALRAVKVETLQTKPKLTEKETKPMFNTDNVKNTAE